ncbi:unnamed protein product [Paramecium pentaurelia]|uniref:Uncharacterized protein n=1 Tax=Paramecium pentaurelia TaxID=43138 RepID=A0A8S1SAH1_9CILI|nr:unnamed protein product [Paramecium pentaurelia]
MIWTGKSLQNFKREIFNKQKMGKSKKNKQKLSHIMIRLQKKRIQDEKIQTKIRSHQIKITQLSQKESIYNVQWEASIFKKYRIDNEKMLYYYSLKKQFFCFWMKQQWVMQAKCLRFGNINSIFDESLKKILIFQRLFCKAFYNINDSKEIIVKKEFRQYFMLLLKSQCKPFFAECSLNKELCWIKWISQL